MTNIRFVNIDIALLLLRIGIGIMFIFHGYPKITGGVEKWAGLGAYGMGSIGIHFAPVFWGFIAAFSEFFGGIMIVLGIYTRYFSILLFSTMFIAACSHLSSGDGIMGASHAIKCAIIFLFLTLSGSGKYGLIND